MASFEIRRARQRRENAFAALPRPLWWRVLRPVTKASAAVLAFLLLFLLLRLPLPIKHWLDAIFPESWLREKASAWDNRAASRARRQVGETFTPAPVPRAFIELGATEDDVLRIEGPPDARDSTVWTYGSSRIYFAGSRVTGWSSSSDRPLKVR